VIALRLGYGSIIIIIVYMRCGTDVDVVLYIYIYNTEYTDVALFILEERVLLI